MARVTLRGAEMHTNGELPAIGSIAPAFVLVGTDLSEITQASLAGKRLVLNIFPSIDTRTCAMSVRAFNERAAGLDDTVVLCVSEDLPFAARRFCGAEGITNVTTGSAFRSDFAETYGVRLLDGVFAGLTARAIVVIDASGTVVHTELVGEMVDEPDYDAALGALA